MSQPPLQINVNPRRVRRGLIVAAVAIAGLGVAAELLQTRITSGYLRRLTNLVQLDAEWTLSSWFATLLLLFSAALLALVATATARSGGRFVRTWRLLAAGFAYLALDEAVGLHELFSRPVQALLGTSGWLHFAWVIPAAAASFIVGLLCIPLLRHLPRRTAIGFVVAAVIYLGGAIGMELVAGAIVASRGREPLVYSLAASAEEILELCGILLFIHALLAYITDHLRVTEISLVRGDSPMNG